MYLSLKNTKKKKLIIPGTLLTTVLLNPLTASAAPDDLSYNMSDGGYWNYTKMDQDYLDENNISGDDFRSLKVVEHLEFIPPEVVETMAIDMVSPSSLFEHILLINFEHFSLETKFLDV
ncbi:hypothetical protein [Alteribacillus sp. HJP-4]|uniref:hypothetical protein n=1 Tax=Alteribacillus sp. HJP-4 TaxID=2775394 RepID=UPI0035CD04D9